MVLTQFWTPLLKQMQVKFQPKERVNQKQNLKTKRKYKYISNRDLQANGVNNINIMNRAQSREMHYKIIYLWKKDLDVCKNLKGKENK